MSEKWKHIGTLLGIPNGTLKRLEAEKDDIQGHLREMLTEWLKQVTPPPSWSQLIDAVSPFDESKAEELRIFLEKLPQ